MSAARLVKVCILLRTRSGDWFCACGWTPALDESNHVVAYEAHVRQKGRSVASEGDR